MNLEIQKKLSQLEPEQVKNLYKQVFNSDTGKLVLEDLRNRCFAYVSTYGNDIEFNEGHRSMLLHIENQLSEIERIEENV